MEKQGYRIKNSLGMFDLLKGIMMVMIFFGHTYGADFIAEYKAGLVLIILLFVTGEVSMPSLFIVSGYGFRKTTIKKCIEKQIKTLLVPYIVTMLVLSIVHFFGYYIMYGGVKVSLKITLNLFLTCLLGVTPECEYFGIQLRRCGPTWFILALMIGLIILNILANYFEGKKLLVASLVVAFIGWLLSLGITIPWCISQGMVATFYICIGHLIKKNKIFTKTHNKKIVFCVSIFLMGIIITLGYFRGRSDMASNLYKYGMLTIILNGIAAAIFLYWFLHLNRFTGVISQSFRKVGRVSLYVFCIHSIEYVGVSQYLQYDFVNNWNGSKIVSTLLIFVIRTFVVLSITFSFIHLKELISSRRYKKESI